MQDLNEKRCPKCDTVKMVDEFGRNKSRSDGLQSWCKKCKKDQYVKTRDATAVTMKKYREDNADAIAAAKRSYHKENRLEIAAKRRLYYLKNREIVLTRVSKYQKSEKNRDRVRSSRTAAKRSRRARELGLPFERVTVKEIALRDGAYCWMCGDELSDTDSGNLDHLVPVAADAVAMDLWGVCNPGTTTANMALACGSCNKSKSNRILLCAVARYLRNINNAKISGITLVGVVDNGNRVVPGA